MLLIVPATVLPPDAFRITFKGLAATPEMLAPARTLITPAVKRLRLRAPPVLFKMATAPPASAVPLTTMEPDAVPPVPAKV